MDIIRNVHVQAAGTIVGSVVVVSLVARALAHTPAPTVSAQQQRAARAILTQARQYYDMSTQDTQHVLALQHVVQAITCIESAQQLVDASTVEKTVPAHMIDKLKQRQATVIEALQKK